MGLDFAVFMKLLEAIVYPGVTQKNLLKLAHKMKRYGGELFVGRKHDVLQKLYSVSSMTKIDELLSALLLKISDEQITRFVLKFDKPIGKKGGSVLFDNKLFQEYFVGKL